MSSRGSAILYNLAMNKGTKVFNFKLIKHWLTVTIIVDILLYTEIYLYHETILN